MTWRLTELDRDRRSAGADDHTRDPLRILGRREQGRRRPDVGAKI